MIRVQFYFIFVFLFDSSWSESIRVDPTQTGGPSWSGPTFVPACLDLSENALYLQRVAPAFCFNVPPRVNPSIL